VKGSLAARWATKSLSSGKKIVLVWTTSGTGKSVQLTTTDEHQQNRWSLQTSAPQQQIIAGRSFTYAAAALDDSVGEEEEDAAAVLPKMILTCTLNTTAETQALLHRVIGKHLTTHQRGCDWFLMRKFLLTSRSTFAMLVIVSRYFSTVCNDITTNAGNEAEAEPKIQTIEKCFGLHRRESPARTGGLIPTLSDQEIDKMKVANLKDFLSLYNLSQTGNFRIKVKYGIASAQLISFACI